MKLSGEETANQFLYTVYTDKSKIRKGKDHRLQRTPVLAFFFEAVFDACTGLLSAVPAFVPEIYMSFLYNPDFIIQFIFTITVYLL